MDIEYTLGSYMLIIECSNQALARLVVAKIVDLVDQR